MPTKLYIYDAGSYQDRWQSRGRFSDDEVVTLACKSKSDMIDGMARLLSRRATFDRMLIQTHGNTGRIFFGDECLWDTAWKADFGGKNLDRLFPGYSRIYFDGCDVASGGVGVAFLRAAGQVFLKGAGGEVTGWTSSGFGLPGLIPFIGGHTVRLGGKFIRVKFSTSDPDGTVEVDEPTAVLPALGT